MAQSPGVEFARIHPAMDDVSAILSNDSNGATRPTWRSEPAHGDAPDAPRFSAIRFEFRSGEEVGDLAELPPGSWQISDPLNPFWHEAGLPLHLGPILLRPHRLIISISRL